MHREVTHLVVSWNGQITESSFLPQEHGQRRVRGTFRNASNASASAAECGLGGGGSPFGTKVEHGTEHKPAGETRFGDGAEVSSRFELPPNVQVIIRILECGLRYDTPSSSLDSFVLCSRYFVSQEFLCPHNFTRVTAAET